MDNLIHFETKQQRETAQRLRDFLLQQIAKSRLPSEDALWREKHQAQDNINDNSQTAEESFKEWYQYLESLGISTEGEMLSAPNFDNRPHQPTIEGFNRIYQSLLELKNKMAPVE